MVAAVIMKVPRAPFAARRIGNVLREWERFIYSGSAQPVSATKTPNSNRERNRSLIGPPVFVDKLDDYFFVIDGQNSARRFYVLNGDLLTVRISRANASIVKQTISDSLCESEFSGRNCKLLLERSVWGLAGY